ncbi:MAG: O-succinylbenzoic acid--CoA ligase [Sphingobacteriales bacterium]|nr:MAG: O-succinylbenzoic acid--CoA ligase [Sphingobacteriales bacterium]
MYSANLTAQSFGLQAGDTFLCCLGTNYIAGFMMVMRALVLDCNLYVSPVSGNPLLNINDTIKIDFVAFVPLQLESIYNSGEKCFGLLNKMRAVIVGGAAVSPSLEEKLQKLQVPVYHTYSMTETYTHVAIRQINGANKPAYYSPLADVKLSVDDRGCLCISSPLTDHKTLVTNDLVELNNDGSFKLIGRIDNVINSGGIKIQAEEIEYLAKKITTELDLPVTELFAYGLPDEKLGQKLVLFIESKSWPNDLQKLFLTAIREKSNNYKTPKQLIFKNKFQRTQTGKVDRNATVQISGIRNQ